MKKILLIASVAVMYTLAPSLAFSKDTLTVVNPSNKASPATVFAKSYEQALRDSQSTYNVDFYQASSCADADAKYKNTKNSIMLANADVNIASLAKGVSCNYSAKHYNTTLITKSYLKFCRKSGSTKEFGIDDTTVGIASVILSPGLFKDLNGTNLKLKGVPYSGSKTVLAAVLAGDLDWGIIGAGVVNSPLKAGTIECPFDYDPGATNFIGNKLPDLKVPTMPIIQIIHHNGDAKVNDLVSAAGTNKKFLDGIAFNGFSETKNSEINSGDVVLVSDHIANVFNNYWKIDTKPGLWSRIKNIFK